MYTADTGMRAPISTVAGVPAVAGFLDDSTFLVKFGRHMSARGPVSAERYQQ